MQRLSSCGKGERRQGRGGVSGSFVEQEDRAERARAVQQQSGPGEWHRSSKATTSCYHQSRGRRDDCAYTHTHTHTHTHSRLRSALSSRHCASRKRARGAVVGGGPTIKSVLLRTRMTAACSTPMAIALWMSASRSLVGCRKGGRRERVGQWVDLGQGWREG